MHETAEKQGFMKNMVYFLTKARYMLDTVTLSRAGKHEVTRCD